MPALKVFGFSFLPKRQRPIKFDDLVGLFYKGFYKHYLRLIVPYPTQRIGKGLEERGKIHIPEYMNVLKKQKITKMECAVEKIGIDNTPYTY